MLTSCLRLRTGLLASVVTLTVLLAGCGGDAPTVEEVSATTAAETEDTAPQTSEPEDTGATEESADTEETSGAEPSPAAEGPEPADSDLITDLALCGDDTYDTDADVCPQMDADFTTSALHCTANAQLEEAGPLDVSFYRNGALAFVASAEIPESAVGSQAPLFADVNVGEMDLPGGDWTCEMQIGASTRETGETTVSGPEEQFSQARACDNDDTFSSEGVTHCLDDAVTLPTDTAEIGCSAVLTDTLDTEMEIRVEWDTEESGTGDRSLGSLTGPAGILVANGFMSPQALTGTPEFEPGTYTCQFLIDGDVVGTHDVTVE